jgi:hypothetical protein
MLEEHEVTPRDYAQTINLHFSPEGSTAPPFPTPSHKLPFTFTFKDYMTNVFRAIRALSNLEEADYMLSLAGILDLEWPNVAWLTTAARSHRGLQLH